MMWPSQGLIFKEVLLSFLLHNTFPPPKKPWTIKYKDFFLYSCVFLHWKIYKLGRGNVTLYVAAPDVKLGFTFGPQLEFDRPTTKLPDWLWVPANLLYNGCREFLPNGWSGRSANPRPFITICCRGYEWVELWLHSRVLIVWCFVKQRDNLSIIWFRRADWGNYHTGHPWSRL
jgi:hypothetical protein